MMIKQVGMIQPLEELNLQILIVAASILVFFLIAAAGAVELQINATIHGQGAWGGYYAGECLNVTMLQNGSQWLINVTGGSS